MYLLVLIVVHVDCNLIVQLIFCRFLIRDGYLLFNVSYLLTIVLQATNLDDLLKV
jgi:hypothetical protein